MALSALPPPALWTPGSWRDRPTLQQPSYPDPAALSQCLQQLRCLPPLVTSWEILALKQQLADAAAGKRFVLQGGDCAERFVDCEAGRLVNKLKILVQMSLVLVHGSKRPVVRMGRFAGQYAKPRSDDSETRDGVTLPSYRGDLVNRPAFTAQDRTPDPQLLLRGYERAALTLNFIRSLVKGGFADLHHPEYWNLAFVEHSPLAAEYEQIVRAIGESLLFMENILGMRAGEADRIDFFTCHEALHLSYEEAQTRQVPRRSGYFNLATHFPWTGIRTADPDGGHIEYLRGIENPVGIKVGPSTTPDQLMRLIDILNPNNQPGRLTFIHRFGHARILDCLPPLIRAVQDRGASVLWICDPMHGNTRITADGFKTRYFHDILGEMEFAFDIHASEGSYLGGAHIELTGDDVTECLGGARGLTESDLPRAYESEVDPRLNYEQALELALLIARKMSALRPKN